MASIEDLDDDIILCNICNNEYDENERAPKLIPCLHTLCNDCTLNAVQGSILKCSICEEEHPISGDLQFLKDCTMRNMMDMIKIQRKSSSIMCSDCPDNNSGDTFCKDCYVFLCKECTSAHRRTQVTRRHVILTLDEMKSAGIGTFTRKEMCSLPGHEDQPFSFYCENDDCQRPVCTQCVVSEHSQSNGHVIRNLNEVHDENKHLVERLVGELLSKISIVSSDTKTLESEASKLEDKHKEAKNQIAEYFDSLAALLKARREKLEQRVDVIVEQQKSEFDQELKRLQKSKTTMEDACNYSSRMLVFTTKPEFLQLKSTVVSKLEQLVDADSPSTTKSQPMELSFFASVDQSKFEESLRGVGEIQTNFYDESNSNEMNGNGSVNGDFVLPYRGPPINPPGKYTTNKFTGSKIGKPNKAKVEPLKLGDLSNKSPPRDANLMAPNKAKTSPPGNLLGRPLSLKSPVITPSKQPSSLGDFLKSQDSNGREPERQLPKTPPPNSITNTRTSPVSSAPLTSPKTPMSPSKFVTSSPKYGGSRTGNQQIPPSTNGGVTSPVSSQSYVQNSNQSTGSKSEPADGSIACARVTGILSKSTQKDTKTTSSISFATGTKPGSPTNNGTRPKTLVLTEDSYPDVKPSTPSPRKGQPGQPVVFGDITCPDFQLDANSAHHEREVSSDGYTLRNRKSDIYSGPVDIDSNLVQYKGAIGTHPFQDAGRFYYEVDVVYNIQQPLEETWLIFEIGLCRLDDVDMHHTVERHEFARSFYVARFPEDGKLTQEFWHNRDLLNCISLSDNCSGLEVRVTYGFLVDTRRKKWIIADCNSNKVLHTFDMLDFTEALYPVFGCYNPDLCTVEMTLKTGTDITMIPECIKPGIRSP